MPTRIVICTLIAALFLAPGAPAFAAGASILVLPFENLTGDRNIDWLRDGISEVIIDRLKTRPDFYVFDREQKAAAYERVGIPEAASVSRATALKLGWDMGADVVVTGAIQGQPDRFSVEARVLDLADLRVAKSVREDGQLLDVLQMAGAIAVEVSNLFGAAPAVTPDFAVPRSAFENYVRAMLTDDAQRRTELLQEAIRLHPQYKAASFQLARTWYLDQKFEESNRALENIAEGDPEYRQARFLKGLNDYYLGNHLAAANVFIELPPTYDVLINLGAALNSYGDAAGALLAWRRASDADPLSSDALFNAGYLNYIRGDMAETVRNLERFVKLEGRDGEALFFLGRAYERLGRVEEGGRLTAQAIRLSPRVERWLTQAIPNLQRLSSLPEAGSLQPPGGEPLWNDQRRERRAAALEIPAWLESVQGLVDSQLFGEAIRQLREILDFAPGALDARLMLAQVYQTQREHALALQAVQAALGYEPDNSEALELKEDLERELSAPRPAQ